MVEVPSTALGQVGPGDLLCGHYRVEARVAEGAYATVFRAVDERTRGTVALKVLDPTKQADPVGEKRFQRELAALKRIDHPNVARAHALERQGELVVLVLEYVEGETLAQRLGRGPLVVEEARKLAAQVADALAACHAVGVVHRDLKPQNVVLHAQRGPVVLDFGVAWYSSALNLTRTGAVVGSPRYMAPETFSSALTDERVDIYALGAVLFEMLTGQPANRADSVGELALLHRQERAPSAAAISPRVPRRLDEIVVRALAPRPAARFATARELADALQSGRLAAVAPLRSNLPCGRCGVPRIIRLPYCPGCGDTASWQLEPGDHAVQITHCRKPDEVVAWLFGQHAGRLRTSWSGAVSRLRFLPATLAVGISRQSALRLADEAGDVSARAVVVPHFALLGPRLRAAHANVLEAIMAPALHAAAVCGTLGILSFSGGEAAMAIMAIPGYAVLGAVLASFWAKRPLMRRKTDPGVGEPLGAETEQIRERLGRLQHDRTRHLAAMAISRAAGALLGEGPEEDGELREQVRRNLADALELLEAVDAQTTLLLQRPRSRLALEIAQAESRAEAGDSEAALRREQLYRERDELLEATIAHDAGVRRVLQLSEENAGLMS